MSKSIVIQQNELPSGWRVVELGDVASVQGGYAFKSDDFSDTGIPVVKIKNVRKRDVDLSEVVRVSKEIADQASGSYIKNGNVLISMTGSGLNAPASIVGRVARHNGEDNVFLINQRVGRFLIKNKNLLDQRFLYYSLSPKEIQLGLVSIATGSANQVNISGKQIEKVKINLPPLPEQKAIADILGKLDDKIELNRQINQTLETMAQTLFKSWFVDFDPVIDNAIKAGNKIPKPLQHKADKRKTIKSTLPKDLQSLFPDSFVFNDTLKKWIPQGWEAKKISDTGNIICGKTPSKSKKEYYGGDIPFLKIPNMHNEVYALETSEYLTELGAMSQENKKISKGSISISCIATVGKVILIDKEAHTNQQINSIIPYQSHYKYYLYFLMLSLNKKFHDLASSGSATLNMNTSTFSNIKIMMPNENVLLMYNKRAKPYFEKILSNQKQTKAISQLRDTLLPKLISGKIRVSNNLNMEK